MNGFSTIIRAMIAALLIAAAAPDARAQQAPLQDKPFAEHRIVLQLSDNDPRKQGLVISVANNLMKFYDPDKVAVEIVTFGPGIDLLRPENPNRKAVESLVAQGARVDICLNTVDTLEREAGKRPEFIAHRDFTPIECLPDDCLSKSYPVDLPWKDGVPATALQTSMDEIVTERKAA